MRLGHLAALQGRHAEALEQFERELDFLRARGPRAAQPHHHRAAPCGMGAAHLRLGAPRRRGAALEVALAAFERRLRMGADDPFTRYYAACAYALRGEPEQALSCLEPTAGACGGASPWPGRASSRSSRRCGRIRGSRSS